MSDDSYTEVTSNNVVQNIFGSIIAALFGLVFFIVAIGLLAWNESRAVTALRGLGEASKEIVEVTPSPVDPTANGKLVHLTGPIVTHGPLSDPAFNVTKDGVIRLQRRVEMYQWKQSEDSQTSNSLGGGSTTTKTYSYSKTWSDEAIDSSRFKRPANHENPDMPFTKRIVTSQDATLGDRTITQPLLSELDDFEALPPPSSPPDGFTVENGLLYRGDGSPDAPKIGDIRVTFSAVPVQTVSVLAKQNGAELERFTTHNNYQIGSVAAGSVDADQMVRDLRSQEKMLTWILRAVGFVLFFFALLLIAAPLTALADIVPFVGSIVGGSVFVFALGLSIALTLLTVGFAWVAVRPLLGLGLLAAAAASIALYRRLRPRRVPRAPVGPQGGAPAR